MKIITLFSSKGGSGKSTTGMTLASTMAYYHGLKVAIFSTDPQGTPPSLRKGDLGADEDDSKYYEIIGTNEQYFYENILPDRKNIEKDGYDYIIVDTPGTMNDYSYLTCLKSDLVLVPVQLTRIDLEAFFGDLVKLITQKLFDQDKSLKEKVYWFGSMTDKRKSSYNDFMELWPQWQKDYGVKILQPGIMQRAGLENIDTISFPNEEDKFAATTRQVMIDFTESVLTLP